MVKGRRGYFPKVVITELEDIKVEHKLDTNKDALNKMVEYTRVGRELERIMRFDFSHKPTKLPKKSKRQGGFFG